MKTLSTAIATLALLSSTAVMAGSAEDLETLREDIREAATKIELIRDLSFSCKINVQVYGIKGLQEEECVKMLSLLGDPEKGDWYMPGSGETDKNMTLGEIADGDDAILKAYVHSHQIGENMEYIKLRIKQ